MNIFNLITGFVIVILGGLCAEIYRELHGFRVSCFSLYSEKLTHQEKPYRIVFLSDLHNQAYGKENKELYSEILRQDPDVILIGGDMLIGNDKCPHEEALKLIIKLAEKYEIYYAFGNHEQRIKETPQEYAFSINEYRKTLKHAGVHFLENVSTDIQTRCGKLRVTGLEIPKKCYVRFRKTLLHPEEIVQIIGSQEKNLYEILMAHNPAYMDSYLQRGADLILSGHYHGGVVRIPGIKGVISPAFHLFPKYSGGYYKEGDTDIIVSKGLGVHTIKIRLFNPAELIVIDINGK